MSSNKIYFNLIDFTKQSILLFEDASEKTGEKQTIALINYLLFLLKNYHDGIIGPKKFAYDIAACMSLQLPKNHELDWIIGEGGSLELPNHHIDGNPNTRLANLMNKIEQVAKKYKVELDWHNLEGGSVYYESDSGFSLHPGS